jgi:hypothetical protein
MAYRLSPSTISLMNDCPRCFWLRFNKNIWRPSGIFPSLPNGIDKILKEHFDSFIGKKKLPIELQNENVKLFDNLDLLNAWRDNREGIRWENDDGNVVLGAIDNILVSDKEKLIVLDYKTKGFPLKENSASYYQNQMDIYNFLLGKNGFETEDFSLLLFYVPNKVNSDGSFDFETTPVKLKVDLKNAEKLISDAFNLLKNECPAKDSVECEWCRLIE